MTSRSLHVYHDLNDGRRENGDWAGKVPRARDQRLLMRRGIHQARLAGSCELHSQGARQP